MAGLFWLFDDLAIEIFGCKFLIHFQEIHFQIAQQSDRFLEGHFGAFSGKPGNETFCRFFPHMLPFKDRVSQRNVTRQRNHLYFCLFQGQIETAGNPPHFINLQRRFSPFGKHLPLCVDTQNFSRLPANRIRNKNLPSDRIGFNAARHVDTAAHHGVLAALAGPDVSNNDFGLIEPDSHFKLGKSVLAILGIDTPHGVLHGNGAGNGLFGPVRHILGCAENNQQSVANDFIDGSVVFQNFFHHHFKIGIQKLNDPLRFQTLR